MINAQINSGKGKSSASPRKALSVNAPGRASLNNRPMAAIALGHKLESERSAVLDNVLARLVSERGKDPKLTRGEKCIEDYF